jgi:outer membrane protein OmpA-like peptidoglycan-associated protein
VTSLRPPCAGVRKFFLLCLFSVLCLQTSGWVRADTAASSYDPPWGGFLSWAGNNSLFARPPLGSFAYLDNNSVDSNTLPWWSTDVAHPITDYDAAKLPTGSVRLDSALMADIAFHRTLPGWDKQASPTGIDNVYAFTPGSTFQEDQTARAGQTAFFDLGLHPIQYLSADIGTEVMGNYDQRYWFPVSDEHRLANDQRVAKIVRGEIKYDNGDVLLRGFEGTPIYGAWLGQNDLFQLLPTQDDVEYYRRVNGSVAPVGGEMRVKSAFGTLDVIGGTQPRWTYGSGVYARYDLPVMKSLEQSLVFRNENIPFGFEDPDERRWALSYNASYPFSDRVTGHAGVLYQPFRLNRSYQDIDSNGNIVQETTHRMDAFGVTARVEDRPSKLVDLAGLGYSYLGPVAGDKQQIDVDAARTVFTAWTFSGAYIYRQPVRGPVPYIFEGTVANPGTALAVPRGPDDPFRVEWDNRKAHIFTMTMVYDPTPGTPFFKQQRDMLEDWNLNPDEDSMWTGAVQYRLTHYLTNTDRLYYYDEDRNLIFDPIDHSGALATSHPFSSATGLLRWRQGLWHVTLDVSGGEELAGAAIAYTPATNFYKPSTVYMSEGLSVDNSIVKAFFRYSQDVWGPFDYQTQLGWTYHRLYQAGLSLIFLKDAEMGFRYTGTRMTDEFIGSDMAAFNEYTFFLTYHFSLEHNFGNKFEKIGRPLPQSFPEVHVTVSDAQFTPDSSGPDRSVSLLPQAYAESGVLSWKLFVRNAQGETVRKWEGNGIPPKAVQWEGIDTSGKILPTGTYRVTLEVADLYGNEATSPPVSVELKSGQKNEPAPPPAAPMGYTVKTTAEGLRVTLNALILFDVDADTLKDSAKEGLDQVVALLKAYPTNALRISGHTDSSGSDAHNENLSIRRAKAVATYFVKTGKIDEKRIKVVGYGKRRPVASNQTEEGRQQNRRVEIDILK